MTPSLFDEHGNPDVSLTYAGTSGWSGTTTSLERVRREDRTGRTAALQAAILHRANRAGFYGVTVAELRDELGEHHGRVSSALTNLHRDDTLARLSEKRGGCKVYVLRRFVAARSTEAPKSNRPKTPAVCPHCHHPLDGDVD